MSSLPPHQRRALLEGKLHRMRDVAEEKKRATARQQHELATLLQRHKCELGSLEDELTLLEGEIKEGIGAEKEEQRQSKFFFYSLL